MAARALGRFQQQDGGRVRTGKQRAGISSESFPDAATCPCLEGTGSRGPASPSGGCNAVFT